jgi:hypothetical protein
MPFTDEEFQQWHDEKQRREYRPQPDFRAPPVAVCINCHQPFGITEGVVTDEVAICDTCNGD